MIAAAAAMALAVPAKESPENVMRAESTSYCVRGKMADGTQTRNHSVAMNSLPLGSKIRLIRPRTFRGMRNFVVRDRIGHGSELDFWNPSCSHATGRWGRKTVKIKVIRRGR